jgi:Group II intron, maturase-specific domain/Reverse transcriptase (RNA-dependent DNA polymerase)
VRGSVQGGVVSPVLCDVHLHRLDRDWQARGRGVLVRYADAARVVQDQAGSRECLTALTAILGELELELKQPKTRIVQLRERGEGVDLLGFHHRWVRGRTAGSRHLALLARWPSRQAMRHARDRLHELTGRDRPRCPVEQTVGHLNRFLRGWAGYFGYGNSTVPVDTITRHPKRAWGY